MHEGIFYPIPFGVCNLASPKCHPRWNFIVAKAFNRNSVMCTLVFFSYKTCQNRQYVYAYKIWEKQHLGFEENNESINKSWYGESLQTRSECKNSCVIMKLFQDTYSSAKSTSVTVGVIFMCIVKNLAFRLATEIYFHSFLDL